MKILSIDIGAKTQDILLYDDSIALVNCIKLVLPAPATVFRKEIIETTGDLVIRGDTIGGGMLSSAIKEHAKKHEVFMTRDAACTIRDDVDVVKSYGIKIVEGVDDADDDILNFEKKFKGKIINLCEINLKLIMDFLINFNENLDIDYIAVAVQDHGAAPVGMSDRKFRFKLFSEAMKKSRNIEDFAFLGVGFST